MPARRSHTKEMSEEARLAKNTRIKEAGKATRARRSRMDCKVFDVKIVENKLNLKQKEALYAIFREYKWIRNSALAAQRFDTEYLKELDGEVQVKTPNGFETRRIEWLGSQMQQGIISTLKSNLKTLATLKKNGRKVGKLKFVSDWNSIDLQQFGVTYKLIADPKGRYTKIQVQNIPCKLRVRGFEQLAKPDIEFANAKLVKRADGFHLLVTAYLPKKETVKTQKIGVDFGIATQFTFSDGSVTTVLADEPERLLRLQRKLSRQEKNSNSYNRTLNQLKREHQRLTNRKNEQANQLVHQWTTNSVVYFQDENLNSWKRRDSGSYGSKKIHHGIMGRVKSRLQQNQDTVMLPKWVATTAWCPNCGRRTKHDLSQRLYSCTCGYSVPRDMHAARNMILLGERYQQFTSGTEGSAGGEKVRLQDVLYAPVELFSMKPETVTALVSP